VSTIVLAIYRFALLLHKARVPLLPRLINSFFLRIIFSCRIGLGAKIGKGVCLAYGGLGTVIHHKAVIGNNVYIGSNVTIGGTNRQSIFPTIGDNCLISTGVRIIGPISIGKNCVIGANAVVVDNIPDNCCAVGIPAKVIKTEINVSDYRDF
jgi:serine O-acetyltransferase